MRPSRPAVCLALALPVVALSAGSSEAGMFGAPPMRTSAAADTDHSTPAHAPDFGSRTLWPHVTGDEAYVKQTWPKARVLVWTGGNGRFADAANWLEDGKPAQAAPDRNTDVVFPPAKAAYKVDAYKQHCRHITIGRNASVEGRNGNSTRYLNVWGNIWIHAGGRGFFIAPVGGGNTFFRRDGELQKDNRGKRIYDFGFGDKATITKYGGASVEILGVLGTNDEIYIASGKTILGPTCRFIYSAMTGNGTFEVYDGATLELQSGAVLAIDRASVEYNVSIYTGGTLQAGSPKRPLTRDAFLRMAPGRRGGLFLEPGARLRVHSAEPAEARLVFESTQPGKRLSAKGVKMVFGGDAHIDGAVFDQCEAGGVEVTDLAVVKGWKHVTLGPNNLAKGQGIFAKISGKLYDRGPKKHRIYVKPCLAAMKQFQAEDAESGKDDR